MGQRPEFHLWLHEETGTAGPVPLELFYDPFSPSEPPNRTTGQTVQVQFTQREEESTTTNWTIWGHHYHLSDTGLRLRLGLGFRIRIRISVSVSV